MVKLEMYLGEAISNIREDRKTTKKLLQDLVKTMSSSSEDDIHKQVGVVAAKYVETLQRSNEQLVKIVALLQKKQKEDVGLSEEDKEGLFDLIKDVKDVA
ncbi:MAG: hypothetical protein CMB80_02400 [Flammeovirgaceae bacterium]|nr:hypothetical protein [Flammeovirgaceae bacterium]|tara:strand:- start:534 stop:833 length:300 start_codon:yes stop_codon:yes gene_type:complete